MSDIGTTPVRMPKRGNVAAIVAGIILAVAVINLLFPHNHLAVGVDHVSYFPPAAQAAWAAISIAAIVAVARARQAPRGSSWLLAAMAVLTVVSLFLFRTQFPTIHGDGEMGGSPHPIEPLSLKAYPSVNGRMQGFASSALSGIAARTVNFEYRDCFRRLDTSINNTWILATIACGAVIVVLAALFSRRTGESTGVRVGLAAMMFSSPAMLNAYGHFDSYIVPVLCVYAWMIAVVGFCVERPRPVSAVLVLILAAFATWAHPLLVVLAVFSALLICLRIAGRRADRIALPTAIAAMLVVVALPIVVGRGNKDLVDPANRSIVGWLLHEKTMSALQVSLPGLVLALIAIASGKRPEGGRKALWAAGLATLVSSLLMFFVLRVGYGMRDEFLYSMFGALILAAAVMLFVARRVGGRSVLCVAVLSVYLYVPHMIVYSNDLMLQRMKDHILYDRCNANRSTSPYRLFALSLPVEGEKYRDMRLSILKEGWQRPLPHLEQFREENAACYAAWCFEFGRNEEGAIALIGLMEQDSGYVTSLWDKSGQFHTSGYLNVAPWACRFVSRRFLDDKLASAPDNPLWRRLSEDLAALQEKEPYPMPDGPRDVDCERE